MKRLLTLFSVFVLLSAATYSNEVYVRIGIVSGDSMFPTLKNNQPIAQILNWDSISKSNVVTAVIYDSIGDVSMKVVKRVYGVPGDVVEQKMIEDEGMSIFLNGEKIARDVGQYEVFRPGFKHKLKNHELFIMGDNHSETSMHIIATNQIIGVVMRVSIVKETPEG
jgi:signal peptidase I